MKKIGIVVCSNSGIDYVEYNENMKISRSILNIEGKEYYDFVDITADDFYNKIKDDKNMKISTSQCPTGVMIEILESFKSEGYTDVIVITISTKMSGTLSSFGLAGEMVDNLDVHLFDSKGVSYGEAYMALTASKMASENKPIEEIISVLENIRNNDKIYVCVDSLHYLVLNGRLSLINGVLGTLLKMKPLLRIEEDGTLLTLEKIRTKNKAVDRMIELVLEDIKDKKILLYAAYTDNYQEARDALDKVISLTNAEIVDVVLVPLTPVVGCHAGPKTFGIGTIIL